MNAAHTLVDTAAELAYLVRLETPAEVHRAITEDIHPHDKDALLVLLAALVDIDRTHAEMLQAVQSAPTIASALDRFNAARVASYEPEHVAWVHGDRDPEVVNRARQYAAAAGAPWNG